jgi:hypothetical protein
MNTESKKKIMYLGNDRRIFARMPATNLESDRIKEQRFQTTCQEIVDLYNMLQHKCIYGSYVNELALYPVIKVQTNAGEPHRTVIV